ncbi:MAG: tyrosine-type recombinase/integrase family protein [Clostridia bacterium]|nr:tyrosine-type recombinase/integrase family protein [Clostridia bacterium]MBQ7727610.1 tyrosine-type recombinase/integrase family protein [Clostridia bacterium]
MPKKANKANKRANGDGSIRQRKDGSWEARFITGTDPVTGKPIRKSIYAKTKPEIAEKLRAATSARDKGDYYEPSKLTVRKWFNIWIAEYCGDKKYSTIKQYKSFGENHICNSLGSIKIAELTPVHLQRFYNDLSRNGKEVQKKDKKSGEIVVTYEAMSAKSVRNIHGILSKCLNVAVNQGLIKSNPAERVTLPKVIRELPV